MNFLTEASNMEEFARRNADVVYVRTPKLYQEYTTMHVLVMEYIEGPAIDDKEKLLLQLFSLNFEHLLLILLLILHILLPVLVFLLLYIDVPMLFQIALQLLKLNLQKKNLKQQNVKLSNY